MFEFMKLTFLGTGAGLPSKTRNVSSLVLAMLEELNEMWLFDCGEATQHQILHTSIKPRKVRNIFITHLHGDHVFGLPGFLSSRSFQISNRESLTIYGPKGIRNYIHSSLKLSKSNLLYPLEIVELEDCGGLLDLGRGWTVEYLPLNHGILSFGYRVMEPDHPGELLMDRVQAHHVPVGPLLGQLKQGKTITLEDGRQLDGKDFIGQPKPGRVVTLLGDTRPCPNIAILAKGADILVHEATHRAAEQILANRYFHSTSRQAAQQAVKAQVGKLLLNHISSRYLGPEIQGLLQEAREIFPQAYLANDFDTIQIPIREMEEQA